MRRASSVMSATSASSQRRFPRGGSCGLADVGDVHVRVAHLVRQVRRDHPSMLATAEHQDLHRRVGSFRALGRLIGVPWPPTGMEARRPHTADAATACTLPHWSYCHDAAAPLVSTPCA